MERRRRVALRKAHTLKRVASVGIVVGVGDTLRGLLPASSRRPSGVTTGSSCISVVIETFPPVSLS